MSCSSLVPSLPNMSTSVGSSPAPSTAVGQVMQDTTDNLFQWAWLSILLVFVFPSMRAPITAFLKALFTVLRLPLDHIIMLYNQKFKNGKET
jgi:hypothetical protein